MSSSNIPVIAIDGPSSSGKGTIGQRLAYEMGFHFLDSGAIYRIVALFTQQKGIDPSNEAAIQNLIQDMDLQFLVKPIGDADVILNGTKVNDEIRAPEVGQGASKISVFPRFRAALLGWQRSFKKLPGLVADGRDMGTVVFPEAEVKIFLTATAETRAKRRYQQLLEKNIDVTLADLVFEMAERDKSDRERAVAPLKAARDAITVDTTSLNVEEVMLHVRSVVNEKLRIS